MKQIYLVHFFCTDQNEQVVESWTNIGPVFSSREKAETWAQAKCSTWNLRPDEEGEHYTFVIRTSPVW